MSLPRLAQSPRDPGFVQDPYPFYARARAAGPLVWWVDYEMAVATDHATVGALLRDRRFGREVPQAQRTPVPPHLEAFQTLEDHSMLEREPPAHTRLRGLVLRAFTSRRIAAMEGKMAALAAELVEGFPSGPFDLLNAFVEPLAVRIIAQLMGVPDVMAPQLLSWSHAMVAMYQARRDRGIEDAANTAAVDFTDYLRGLIAERRRAPGDDLLSELIAARDGADKLSEIEMIATAILLLNAGHEATVHSIGNGVKALLEHGLWADRADGQALTEEVLRYDPPLHMFTRFAREDVTIAGHRFDAGAQVGLLLAAAGRDEAVFEGPDRFDPGGMRPTHAAFGAGIHFCVGAPLARAQIAIALETLTTRCPNLRLDADPQFADRYHFHGLDALTVRDQG